MSKLLIIYGNAMELAENGEIQITRPKHFIEYAESLNDDSLRLSESEAEFLFDVMLQHLFFCKDSGCITSDDYLHTVEKPIINFEIERGAA